MKKFSNIIKTSGIGRSFFWYLIVSFVIIFFVVISILWFTLRYFITESENMAIRERLTVPRDMVRETERKHQDTLELLISAYREDPDLLSSVLPDRTMLYVFDEEYNMLYGTPWNDFTSQLFITDPTPRSFLFADKQTIYQVSADLGDNKYFYVSLYSQVENPIAGIDTYVLRNIRFTTNKNLSKVYNALTNHRPRQDILIVPISYNLACGVFVERDIIGNVVIAHLFTYEREMSHLLHRSFLMAFYLLLALVLIMSAVASTIISNRIFTPLWALIDKMKFISQKPQLITPLPRTTHGEILEIYSYFNKMITSIIDYQSELSSSKELIETINAGIFRLDEKGIIKQCNNAFKKIFEIKKHDNINIKNILPIEFINNKPEVFRHRLDPKYENLSINIHAYKDENHTEFFGIIYDMTDEIEHEKIRTTLELELIRINRLSEIGRRIQGIVHNINTPLNSIIGYAQLIAEDNIQNNDAKKIIDAAINMSEVIKLLLHKTMDDSIAMRVPINLNNLLEQELSFCTHDLYFKHNVKLYTNFYDDLPDQNLVYGDISQVFQILFNNAIESMYNTTTKILTVSTFHINEPEDECVGFSVKDTGVGIPKDDLETIFELSYTTKEHKPTSEYGLGLPLAKSIMNKMNGIIEVHSEQGVGSEFIIKIPT